MSDSEVVRRIAERAMGWEVVERDSARHQEIILCETPELTNACMLIDGRLCKWTETRPGYIELVAFTPLENIADAFQVVEKMREREFRFSLEMTHYGRKGGAVFAPIIGAKSYADFQGGTAEAARAICLAAIAALEGE